MSNKKVLRTLFSYSIMILLMLSLAVSGSAEAGWQTEDDGTVYIDINGNRAKGLKSINNKLYFFNDNGYVADEIGIDVSEFNRTIQWKTVSDLGISFAVIRVGGRGWGSGKIYEDSFAAENLHNAQNANLKIGVYFYSTAINVDEAIAEAEYVNELLDGIDLDMPVFFDTEWSGNYPNGRSDALSPNMQAKIADAFCNRMKQHGYPSGTYSNLNYYYYSINYSVIDNYTVWMASYTDNYLDPAFKYDWDIWQFTDSEYLNGIEGTVDLNVIYYN